MGVAQKCLAYQTFAAIIGGMGPSARLNSSAEDYLEAIFQLIAERGAARAGEVAKRLGVHKSTVTGALRSLAEKGLVSYAPYTAARLTARGRHAAGEVVRRHEAIYRFLRDVLLLPAGVAQVNACRIEHAVDPQVVERLLAFVEFERRHRRGHLAWSERFGQRTADGEALGRDRGDGGMDRTEGAASGE